MAVIEMSANSRLPDLKKEKKKKKIIHRLDIIRRK
jgi:hypothetical protein